MGTIHRPWYSGSGGTEAADFIQCISSIGSVIVWGLAVLYQKESIPNGIFWCLACSYQ